jgi:hypothetical protein
LGDVSIGNKLWPKKSFYLGVVEKIVY